MGASWRRGSAAALLLVIAAALLPSPVSAGSAADPEVTDPAGDQEIREGDVPVVPGVNDEAFDDVDLVAAYVTQFTNLTRITVVTTAGWSNDGSMTVAFNIDAGPTSLVASTASGQAFTVFVNGTTVEGVEGSAATTTDGLRIDVPTGALGAVGGDLLSNLTLTTSRTDDGFLVDLDPDDQTGSDTAGPGRSYMFERPPVSAGLDLAVVSVDGAAGGTPGERQGAEAFDIVVRLTNLGTDPDRVVAALGWNAEGADDKAQALAVDMADPASGTLVAPGESIDQTFTVTPPDLEGLHTMDLGITARSERGAQDSAQVHVPFHVEGPPPATREVKPAGLTFLTSGAEAMGLDDAFGSYGEAFLLAMLVLLTILALFLLLALGRSTTEGEPAAEAPWPAGAGAVPAGLAGPAGLAETVRATPARYAAAGTAAEAAEEPEEMVDFGALMATQGSEEGEAAVPPLEFSPAPAPVVAPMPTAAGGARIRIEEVRHTPREPEAGQRVTTEVILRNDGPSATLRIALSIDGKPAAERTVQVASRATKAVELPWTAGAGDNRVRIQAFPA